MTSAQISNPATAHRDDWLLDHARNVTSQYGEDGILAKILETLPTTTKWCVEFGAWDGQHLSNTRDLIATFGYHGVLIECDPERYVELQKTYAASDRVVLMNEFVGFGKSDGLDALLAKTEAPVDFDVLSIDIDGNDYHVWEALRNYRPRVVVVEYNPTIPTPVDFVQEACARVNQGASLAALVRLGKSKEYELVATTKVNAFFVDRRFFPLFNIQDNSASKLRRDESSVTYIFAGFDGTIFVRGATNLHWHGVPIDERRLQLLPRVLRKYPGNYATWERVLARVWRDYWSWHQKR